MPVEMPWIRTYDYPGEFTKGYGLGAQQAEANARIQVAQAQLNAEQERAALDAELKRNQLEQQKRIEESRLAVAEAYHQAQISMQQEKLKEAQKVNEMKWLQTGRQWAEQQAYLKDVEEGKLSAAEAAARHPGMFGTGAGLGQVISAAQRSNIPLETRQEGGETYLRTPGGWSHVPKGTAESYAKSVISSIQINNRQREAWLRDNARVAKESQIRDINNQILEDKNRANRVAREGGLTLPYPEVESQARDWSGARQIGGFKVIQE